MGVEIIHGDCLDVLRGLPDASVDAVICDPPYGTTACKWDAPIPFAPMWAHLARVCKPAAAMVFFAAQPFTSALVMSKPEWFRHEWIWWKDRGSNFLNTSREPMKEHESIVVFSRGGWTFNRQLQERAPAGAARLAYDDNAPIRTTVYNAVPERKYAPGGRHLLRVPTSVQRFNKERGFHPSQKPIDLCRYLIRTYTDPGHIVLDFAAGSGTTGVGALLEGRRAILIEREAAYVEIARKRVAEAGQQPRLFAQAAD